MFLADSLKSAMISSSMYTSGGELGYSCSRSYSTTPRCTDSVAKHFIKVVKQWAVLFNT